MRPGQRKARAGVIERSATPRRGGRMAGFAGGGKTRLHVIRARGALKIRHVARRAHCIRRRQPVIVIHVAGGTSGGDVCAGQREASGIVIETGRGPGSGRVARLAIGGESALRVIGITRSLEVRHVAGRTGRVRGGQIEIPIHVAGRTRHAGMGPCQRKSGGAVVKSGVKPCVHPVAGLTIGREFRGNVVGRRRALEVLGVAGVALRGKPLELACRPARVTCRAFSGRMRSRQRKPILVRANRLHPNVPPKHRVTLLAISAELAAVYVGVAIRALRADIVELRLGMTIRAVDLGVHTPQGIAGLVVIKLRDGADRFPARQGVAILAGDRDGTVRISRLGRGRAARLRLRPRLEQQQDESHRRQ